MTFLWPQMLSLAAALPMLVIGYLLLVRRSRVNITLSDLTLVRLALRHGPAWKRRFPPLLLLASACLMVVAAGRPVALIELPAEGKTIILVMDVSGSMGAVDVAPNRIKASQAAAKSFVQQLPAGVKVGVVAYGGSAHVVQMPTTERNSILAAIERFQLQPGTAIGSGLVVGLATLFPSAGYDVAAMMGGRRRGRLEIPPSDGLVAQPGTNDTAAVVLLSDGQNTTGPDPLDAARLAARHGVRVYTVGFGTPDGIELTYNGWSMRVWLDEDTLREIAGITRAEYFAAPSGADLRGIYRELRSRLVVSEQLTEVTVFFALAAALLVLLSVALSVRWFGRVA